jgi:CheY-like chemotaxis protein
MDVSFDNAGVLPAGSSMVSGPPQARAGLVRELGDRITAAREMASAVRMLDRRSGWNGQEREQLLALQNETSRLLNALQLMLVDAGKPSAGNVCRPCPLLSPSALLERFSASLAAQLGHNPGIRLELRESLLIQFSGNEAVIEQILVFLVRSIQTGQGHSIGIQVYSDPRQRGRGDLWFEVCSHRPGCSLPADMESELTCAEALAQAIGAEVTACESTRQAGQPALQLRVPACVFSTSEKPLRLLLVDDRRINQLVLADELGSLGHRVVVAGDGPTALELLGRQDFDAVLTDLNMPDMNGLELTGSIRALRAPASRLPIIVLVSEESPVNFERSLMAGASAIARKHGGPEHILSALAHHFPSNAPLWRYMPAGEFSLTVH